MKDTESNILSLLGPDEPQEEDFRACIDALIERAVDEGLFGKITKTLNKAGAGKRYSDIAKTQASKNMRNKRTTAMSVRGRHKDDRG